MEGEIRIEKLWDPAEAEGEDAWDVAKTKLRPGFRKPYFYRFMNGTTKGGDWLYDVINDYIYYGAYRGDELVGFMMTLAKHKQKPTDNVSFIFVDDAPTYDALLKHYTKETGDKQDMKLLRYDVSRPVPGTFESLPEYEREPPGFNRVEAAEGQPFEYVPDVVLGESTTPAVAPAVVRFREAKAAYDAAKDARYKAASAFRLASEGPTPVPQEIAVEFDRALLAFDAAKQAYEEAKAALPSRSVGRFGGRRRAQTRRRKRQRRPTRRNRTTRRA